MRKTLRLTIPGEPGAEIGTRDNGKTFVLTEMSADDAERWALRLVFAMANQGVDVPENPAEASIAALAQIGYAAIAKIKWADAEPLLAEMMACVQYAPQAANAPLQKLLSGAACQIEDVRTRVWLRLKVFELHTGFSMPELPPISG